ncbi:hypothetical protein [Bremerella cremea]|uniref:hypothetical protein n=1 Tax=Bremerella cremea TaxID=1031537 RepID=UPI0031EB1059
MKSLRLSAFGAAVTTLSLLALLTGCGPDDGLLHVSGTVTLDGQPIENGSISFMPVNGGSMGGGLIENGQIDARSAPGEMAVQIHAHKTVQVKNPSQEQIERGLTEETVSILPAPYNQQSKLRIKVDSSNHHFDFDLKKDGTIPEGMGVK